MVSLTNLVAYCSAAVIPIPFIVVFYFLRKQPYVPKTIKLFWLVGFLYGIVFAVQCVFIVHPDIYLNWYGLSIMGISIGLSWFEHFIWGMEYFYSSENLIRATTSFEI